MRIFIGTLVLAVLATPSRAQDISGIGVGYTKSWTVQGETVEVGSGKHFVAHDGRYRHDTTEGGTRVSRIRLPGQGREIAINHGQRQGVSTAFTGGGEDVRYDPRTLVPEAGGTGEQPMSSVPESIGEKTIGPLVLRGFRSVIGEGDNRIVTEVWHYEPLQMLSTFENGRLPNPPIVMEVIMNGQEGTYAIRISSARRETFEPGTFDAPSSYSITAIN